MLADLQMKNPIVSLWNLAAGLAYLLRSIGPERVSNKADRGALEANRLALASK